MKYLLKNKKGFTLVELIVTIAVLAILLLIGAPRLIGHVEQAQLTRIQHDVKVMENEIKLAMLDDDVDLADWDTNAKDLAALIVQDKLYDKKGFSSSIDKSHLESYFNNQTDEEIGQGGMLYALGNIGPNADTNESDEETLASIIAAGYKIIPEEHKKNINTRLDGTFYTNEEGTIYYEHDRPLASQKTTFDKVCEAPVPAPDYDFDHETGTIIKWNGTEQHLTIPSAFKVGDECYPVRVLGERSFMQGQLRKIVIPQSVQRIERQAFYENNLTEVYIPHSVNYIGGGAFEYNYIEEVTIANKIGVVTVSGDAFQNNGPSRNQTVTPSYRQPTNRDLGIIFDTSRGAIVASSKPSTQDRVLHIPETIIVNEKEYVVKTVDKGAYQGLGLISVVMPEGLERIEDYAFSGNQLTGVAIPSTVNYIGNYAFSFNEQIHSETGEIKPTIESVIINGNEQINKIDKHGDIKEHGTKVVLLDNKVTLKDQIFVNSLGNRVVIVDEFVPGTTEEQKEKHIINDKIINIPGSPSKPSEPSEPEIDEDGAYVSPALGPEGLMSVADYGLVAPITDPEGLVSVVDYETVDPITNPEGLDSLRQYNDGPISFRGIDSAAFDNSNSTYAEFKVGPMNYSSNKIVKWSGDITDRIITVRATANSTTSMRMRFINDNKSTVPHQIGSNDVNYQSFSSSDKTVKVKVPKGATGIEFYNSSNFVHSGRKVYDMSVEETARPRVDKDTISHTATTSSITFNWDSQYKKAYIYEGNKFLAEVNGNTYTHTPLYSNTAHTYNITLLNDKGIGTTATYKANVKTIGVDFRGLDAKAFDDSNSTYAEFSVGPMNYYSNKIVKWSGDITDRIITVRATANSSTSMRMRFINDNKATVPHQIGSNDVNYQSFSSSDKIVKVKVPKGATGIEFYNSSNFVHSGRKVYDVSVEETDRPRIDKNTISHTATTSSITFNWDSQYKKAYIYEGNKFLAEVNGNTYTHTPLYSNTSHTYNITLLNDEGIGTTATYKANVKTIGVDFRGLDAKAFDDSNSTYAEFSVGPMNNPSNKIVKWSGDITDRIITVRATANSTTSMRMRFVNDNNSTIPHQVGSNDVNYQSFSSSDKTVKVKVPKGATGIEFYGSSSTHIHNGRKVYDVSVEKTDRPRIDKNTISHTATTSSITFNWDSQYEKAYIYEGNKFLAEVNGNTYTHTPLYSNTAHTYNITLLNDEGVGTTATYKANVKTIGVDFRGLDAKAFDNSNLTYAEFSVGPMNNPSNKIVKWSGDITDRIITVRATADSTTSMRMRFVNDDKSTVPHQVGSNDVNYQSFSSSDRTVKVKVPKGATGIEFYGSSSTHIHNGRKVYDVSIAPE